MFLVWRKLIKFNFKKLLLVIIQNPFLWNEWLSTKIKQGKTRVLDKLPMPFSLVEPFQQEIQRKLLNEKIDFQIWGWFFVFEFVFVFVFCSILYLDFVFVIVYLPKVPQMNAIAQIIKRKTRLWKKGSVIKHIIAAITIGKTQYPSTQTLWKKELKTKKQKAS